MAWKSSTRRGPRRRVSRLMSLALIPSGMPPYHERITRHCILIEYQHHRILQDHLPNSSPSQRAAHPLHHLLRPLRPRTAPARDPAERQAICPPQVLRLRPVRLYHRQAKDQAQAPHNRRPRRRHPPCFLKRRGQARSSKARHILHIWTLQRDRSRRNARSQCAL